MGWVASGFGRSRGSTFDCFNNWSGEVSSLIDASELLGHEAQNGECESGIIHFDATQRRKDKMRQKSQVVPQTQKHEPQPEAPPQTKTAPPIREMKAQTTSEPVKKPATNGAATLSAYSAPPAK